MMMTGRRPQMAVTGLLLLLMMMTIVMMTGVRGDDDKPLILTPFIKNGSLNEAKRLSRVPLDFTLNVESYSGFLTVNETYDSNLFFWFFPTQNESAPLLLWLNGGPGSSSLLGVLLENGPLKVNSENPELQLREVNWASHFHMLYIDNPVGAGFSFTGQPEGYTYYQPGITANLYKALTQFYQMFTEYQNNDLYIGGQSYAGKYIPPLGYHIHHRNEHSPEVHLPLKGMYLGGGAINFRVMLTELPESLYQTGMINEKSRNDLDNVIRETKLAYTTRVYRNLTMHEIYYMLFSCYLCTEMGQTSNILGPDKSLERYYGSLKAFVRSNQTGQALHVGNLHQNFRDFNPALFFDILTREAFMDTDAENVFLIENYKVLYFSGNLDLSVSVAMVDAMLENLRWSGRNWYLTHHHRQWWNHARTHQMGWYTSYGNFTKVTVKDSGHDVPFNQPEAALDMMLNFIYDKPFHEKKKQ